MTQNSQEQINRNQTLFKRNRKLVGEALTEILMLGLELFVKHKIKARTNWLQGLRTSLRDYHFADNEPKWNDPETLLNILLYQWNVFQNPPKLGHFEKSLVSELITVRHQWAHNDSQKFTTDYTFRCLDSIARLLAAIPDEQAQKQAQKAEQQKEELLQQYSAEISEATQGSARAGINWRVCCRAVLNTQNQMQVSTNPLTRRDGMEFELDDSFYVPLGLMERKERKRHKPDISPEQGAQTSEPEYEVKPIQSEQFFEQASKQDNCRLAIIGEPGAGKTTLLRRIAFSILEHNEGLPILISLADLQTVTHKENFLEKHLFQNWLKAALPFISPQTARVTPEIENRLVEQFNSGHVWLLLDAVDEMSISSGDRLLAIRNQLQGWIAQARIVLTCRLNVWDANKNALENFTTYRTLDFSYGESSNPNSDQVAKFINNWFKSSNLDIGKQLRKALDEPSKERIKDLVKNPLRLALLCRTWQRRRGGLPDTKAKLYEQFIADHYLWKQDEFPTTSDRQDELNAKLGQLALTALNLKSSWFRLSHTLVCQVLGKPDRPAFQLVLQLGLLNRVGIAIENPDEEVYAFSHPTFQEYFAALAVDNWHYFLNHTANNPSTGNYRIFEPQWKEVILLWFGRQDVSREQKEGFIKELYEFEDDCDDFFGYRAFLLAAISLTEFVECSLFSEILNSLVEYCFGFLDKDKKWQRFPKYIELSARKVLQDTEFLEAMVPLAKLLFDKQEADRHLDSRADDVNLVAYTHFALLNPNPSIIDVLLSWLENSDDDTRNTVADILKKIGSRKSEVLYKLVNILSTTHLKNFRECQEEGYKAFEVYLELINSMGLCEQIAKIIKEISPANVEAVNTLIEILRLDEIWDTRVGLQIVEHLHLIDPNISKNSEITKILIELLQFSNNEYYSCQAAKALIKISLHTPETDNILVKVLSDFLHSKNDFIRKEAAKNLVKIDPNHTEAIQILIEKLCSSSQTSRPLSATEVTELFGETSSEELEQFSNTLEPTYVRDWEENEFADVLKGVTPGNTVAINGLVHLVNTCQNHGPRYLAAFLLGTIGNDSPEVVNALTNLQSDTEYPNVRVLAAKSLWKIQPNNSCTLKTFTELLQSEQDIEIREWIVRIIGNLDVLNPETVMDILIKLLDSKDSLCEDVVNTLGKIGSGNKKVINALSQLLYSCDDQNIKTEVAVSLGKIDTGNQEAVSYLLRLLRYSATPQLTANIVKKVLPNSLYPLAISSLKDSSFNNECSELLWHCSQNMTYPEFYCAWHSQPVNSHPEPPDNIPIGNSLAAQSLKVRNLDLNQLQATPQTYPLPVNTKALEDDTDQAVIYQNLCNKIYKHRSVSIPGKPPDARNAAELQQNLFFIQEKLKRSNLALVFYSQSANGHFRESSKQVISLCQRLADSDVGLYVGLITNQPVDPPLKGFPSEQPDLLSAIQSWVEEID